MRRQQDVEGGGGEQDRQRDDGVQEGDRKPRGEGLDLRRRCRHVRLPRGSAWLARRVRSPIGPGESRGAIATSWGSHGLGAPRRQHPEGGPSLSPRLSEYVLFQATIVKLAHFWRADTTLGGPGFPEKGAAYGCSASSSPACRRHRHARRPPNMSRQASQPHGKSPSRCLDCVIRNQAPCRAMTDAAAIASLELARSPFRSTRAGGVVFEQGTLTEYIYIIERGWVGLYNGNSDGKNTIVGFALPGDVLPFGRDAQVHTHSAVALENVTVCMIHRSRQEHLEREHPAYNALHRSALGQALDAAEATLAAILFGTAQERIAHLLWSLAARSLHRAPLQSDRVTVPISHIQIALATGMTPVHVSRTLRNLREGGVLEFDRHVLTVRNRAKTERLAGLSSETRGLAPGPTP